MLKKIIKTHLSICKFDDLSIENQQLIASAKEQVSKSYAPYSGFHVGASVLLNNGEIYAASNQENSAYPSGLCAERVAMFYANAQFPNEPVKAIAIAAHTNGNFLKNPITPCGSCRQVLLESEVRLAQEITIILYGTEDVYIIDNVKQLLPLCFEKRSLQK